MKRILFLLLFSPLILPAQIQKNSALGADKTTWKTISLSNEVVYFQRNDQLNVFNNSIWATNGSASGTKKIAGDLQMENVAAKKGDSIFYFAYDNLYNLTLYSYSSTSGITTIKNLPQNADGNVMVVSQKYLYFITSVVGQTSIWKSDGTTQGTQPIGFNFNLQQWEGVNSIIPFQNNLLIGISRSSSYELWNYDPMADQGTLIYSSGTNQYNYASDPSYVHGDYTILNNIIYFSGYDGAHGRELWRSDGTTNGTYLVADIDPRIYTDSYVSNYAYETNPHQFFTFNGLVYFLIDKFDTNPFSESVSEFWVSDGTNGGVNQIQSSVYKYGSFDNFSNLNSNIIFTYDDEIHGNELWISDGKNSGTKLLLDLWNGPASSVNHDDTFLNTGSEVYFSANDGKIGNELWKFDPATKNTLLISDILAGSFSSNPRNFCKINNLLVFIGSDANENLNFYSIDLASVLPITETPSSLLPASQWFQTIGSDVPGGTVPFYYNYDLVIDSKNNIYFSGQFNRDKTVFYENSTIVQLPSYVGHAMQVSKILPDGLLQWQKVLHTTNNPIIELYNGPMIAPTTNNDIVVASSFFSSPSSVWTNYLGLPLMAYSGFYVTKLDENGNKKWAKYLFAAEYQPYVHSVKSDEDGNIYVAGLYYGGLYWNDQLVLTNEYSPTNFLLKLDTNGDLVWIKNVITNWPNYGKIADLKIDSESKKIYFIISEGTRAEVSCQALITHHLDLVSVDLNGQHIRSKQIESSDLMLGSSFDISSVGDFYITGKFRGTITSDHLSLTTPPLSACSFTEGFVLQLDSEFHTIALKPGKTEFDDPYELKFLPTGNYILSGTIGENIFINKYDPLNNLLEKKIYNKNPHNLNLFTDDTFSNPIIRFDSQNNFILSDRYSYGFDSIANALVGASLKSFIMKAPVTYLQAEPVSADDYPIEFFPNPANERVNIKIWGQPNLKFKISVFDVMGKQMIVPEVNNESEIYFVDVSHLASGLYFFIFDNGSQRTTKKIIIAH